MLDPLPPHTTYFDYLLGAERLAVEPAELIRRFHQASLRVHPDRFATAGPEAQALSAEHAEFLNQAYRTLRDPVERARYFLTLHPAASPGHRVPVVLAEAVFELQELEEASPEEARGRASELRAEVAGHEQTLLAGLQATFSEWDAQPTVAARDRIAALLHDLSYARAMLRDIQARF